MIATLQDMRAQLEAMVGDVDAASAKGRKRRRILEGALDRFVALGYRKANIEDIARAAGVAKGTVYLYFATKAELLLAALALEKLRLFGRIALIFAPGIDARERLRRYIVNALLMVADSPLISASVDGDPDILGALAELDPSVLARATADQTGFVAHLLDQAVAPAVLTDDQRRERIQLLTGLARMAPRIRSDGVRGTMSVEQFADALATALVDGLARPG